MSVKFAFIGGTKRGYRLINALLQKELIPEFAVILEEDEHESEKYSDKIIGLLNDKQVLNSISKKLSDGDYEKIRNLELDFVIVFGWRTLIDTKINDSLKLGLVASHFSLLPKYRGFAPLQWAIINDEKETGVTLFLIQEGKVDSGKLISQKKVPVMSDDYAAELNVKLTDCAIEMYLELFRNFESGKIKLTEQNEADATYCCKRTPEDGKIDWNKSSAEIYNLIRALAHPYPGAFCEYKGETFHIRKAVKGEIDKQFYSGRIPGRVISIEKNSIEVLCGSGSVKILEWENKVTTKINFPSEIVKSLSSTLK